MANIASPGIGSGLDVAAMVRQLVDAERAPAEARLARKEARLQAQLSALGTVRSALSSFRGRLSGLADAAAFARMEASSSDPDTVAATVGEGTAAGSYSVTVSRLARAHALASAAFSDPSDVVGTGQLTIRFGKTVYDPATDTYTGFTQNPDAPSLTLTIDSSNNTLAGIRDAINAADAGVQAAIVNDGSGYRLVLTSKRTGEDYSMEVSVSGDGDGSDTDNAGLSRLAFNASATNLEQTVAAQDASLTINGLAVTSDSNTVDGAVEGLTLELKATTSAAVTVQVALDRAAIESAVQGFVDGFNELVDAIRSVSSYDAATETAGVLIGDSALRAIESRLRRLISDPVEAAGGSYRALVDIGIRTGEDGRLELDRSALGKALDADREGVAALFAAYGRPTDTFVRFEGAGAATEPGSYAVKVTALATRGRYEGAGVLPDFSAGGTVTIDANNDTFALKVDGIQSGTVTLTQGTYSSGEALAAEIQARINADQALKDAGVSVDVSYDAANARLVVTSARYGSASTVELTAVDTSTASTLGFSVGAGTAGTDVAGSIGGVAATGSGQVLTGAKGSPAEGLALRVLGGATGDRGTVAFTRGVAAVLDELVGEYLADDGLLDAREEGVQASIEDVAAERERLERRLQALEARYRAQFTALDVLLGQLSTTSAYLQQQLNQLAAVQAQARQR